MNNFVEFKVNRVPIGPLVRVSPDHRFYGGDWIRINGRDLVVVGADDAARVLAQVEFGGWRHEALVRTITCVPFEHRGPRACYALPSQFASRASMRIAKAARCIPRSVDASRS